MDWSRFVSELRVYDIDVNKISLRGSLVMNDMYELNGRYGWPYNYSPWVRRSVMAADEMGNDFVYAISDAGIRVANSRTLGMPLATAMFPVSGPKGSEGEGSKGAR